MENLQKAAGPEDSVSLSQSQIVARHVHEGHHRGDEIELRGPERQFQPAGLDVPDAERPPLLGLPGETEERGRDIHRVHPRAAPGKQAGVMSVAAAHVQTSHSGDIRQQFEERGCVDGVAVHVPALPGKLRPGGGVAFPVAPG